MILSSQNNNEIVMTHTLNVNCLKNSRECYYIGGGASVINKKRSLELKDETVTNFSFRLAYSSECSGYIIYNHLKCKLLFYLLATELELIGKTFIKLLEIPILISIQKTNELESCLKVIFLEGSPVKSKEYTFNSNIKNEVTLGSDNSNDIVLYHKQVSKFALK